MVRVTGRAVNNRPYIHSMSAFGLILAWQKVLVNAGKTRLLPRDRRFCSCQRNWRYKNSKFVHLYLTFFRGACKIYAVWCTLPQFGLRKRFMITGKCRGLRDRSVGSPAVRLMAFLAFLSAKTGGFLPIKLHKAIFRGHPFSLCQF